MDAAKKLDKEIASYLTKLNEQQKRAVLTVVKTFAGEEEYDHWQDPSFVEEVETRYNDWKSGKVEGVSTEEMKERITKSSSNNYTAAEKKELDRRVNYYLGGGKMVTPAAMNKRLKTARKKNK